MSTAPPLWLCCRLLIQARKLVMKMTACPGIVELWPFQWQQGWGGIGADGKKWGQVNGF